MIPLHEHPGARNEVGAGGVRGRAYDHVSIGYPLRGCFF